MPSLRTRATTRSNSSTDSTCTAATVNGTTAAAVGTHIACPPVQSGLPSFTLAAHVPGVNTLHTEPCHTAAPPGLCSLSLSTVLTHPAGEHPKQQDHTVPTAAVPGVAPAAQVAEQLPRRRGGVAQQRQPPPVGACAAEGELSTAVVLDLAEHLGWQHGRLLLQPPAARACNHTPVQVHVACRMTGRVVGAVRLLPSSQARMQLLYTSAACKPRTGLSHRSQVAGHAAAVLVHPPCGCCRHLVCQSLECAVWPHHARCIGQQVQRRAAHSEAGVRGEVPAQQLRDCHVEVQVCSGSSGLTRTQVAAFTCSTTHTRTERRQQMRRSAFSLVGCWLEVHTPPHGHE